MAAAGPLLRALCALAACGLAASKGCFLPTAEVAMADGSQRRLQDVRPGDRVVSWDEASGRPAVSVVKAAPSFQRRRAELVELSLPSVALLATEDHPFWSRSRQQLVSSHPNSTFEEYELRAELMGAGEELEDTLQRAVGVSGIRRLDSPPQLRSLQSTGPDESPREPMVEVMTLCLEPHHWYYVHGVRVHNKGCFVKTSEVTMADGSRRQIQDLRPGDEVASWDEEARRSATSRVQEVPRFTREEEELVEVSLPSATIHATEDHPFWSRSRGGLASLHPNGTLSEYSLEASLLEAGEELEDERQQAVPVAGLRRLGATASPERSLRSAEGAAAGGSRRPVEVMTLCLQPHHWYYVHGVRVHNKGCFAPWTPVMMEDGSQKPISAVRAKDRVASWDAAQGRRAAATVLEVEVFPAGRLLELALNATPGAAPAASLARQLRRDDTWAGAFGGPPSALVVTEDHPIYSARLQGLVSMAPAQTRDLYGLQVSQMETAEVLHHFQGHGLAAAVRNWTGSVPHVMTLRLDEHHWFYAGGVRVHNKGGGGGGGGGSGGFGGGGARVTKTRAAYAAPAAFGALIIMRGGSRRRYGTYENSEDGECDMKSASEVGSACNRTILNQTGANGSWCYDCLDCESEACMDNIPECDEFLAEAFEKCEWEEEDDNGWVAAIFVMLLVGAGIGCCCCFWKRMKRNNEFKEMQDARMKMVGSKGALPSQMQLHGTYTENGETKPCSYVLQFDAGGAVQGTGQDDDGTANVTGVVSWPPTEPQGHIMWNEWRAGAAMEVDGQIFCAPGSSLLRVTARYISTVDNTKGSLTVMQSAGDPQSQQGVPWGCQQPGQPMQAGGLQNYAAPQGQFLQNQAAPTIVVGTVIGAR